MIILGDIRVTSRDRLLLLRDQISVIKDTFKGKKVVGNLETSIRFDESVNPSNFKAVPLGISVECFKSYPDVHYSLFNNHSQDYGKSNFEQALQQTNIIHDQKTDNVTFFVDKYEDCQGFSKSLYWNARNISNAAKETRTYAIVHGGLEFNEMPTRRNRILSELAIDNGFLGVVFTHTHALGCRQFYKGKSILYGLPAFNFESGLMSDGFDGYFVDCSSTLAVYKLDRDNSVQKVDLKTLSGGNDDYWDHIHASVCPIGTLRPKQNHKSFILNDVIFYVWNLVAKLYVFQKNVRH